MTAITTLYRSGCQTSWTTYMMIFFFFFVDGPLFCQPIDSKMIIDRFDDPLERSVLSDATVMQPLEPAATTVTYTYVIVNNIRVSDHEERSATGACRLQTGSLMLTLRVITTSNNVCYST
jgi:hypothetical protein